MGAPLDIEALERTARESAENLPGEWRIDTDEASPSGVAYLDRHAGEERWVTFAHCSGGCLEWLSASDHIATFDPPTVIRLLADRAALLNGCNALLGLLTLIASRDDLSAHLRSALEAQETHRIGEARAAIAKAGAA